MLSMIIWLLLGLQIGCLVYAIAKKENPWDVLYGFSIWGCAPIIVLQLISIVLRV